MNSEHPIASTSSAVSKKNGLFVCSARVEPTGFDAGGRRFAITDAWVEHEVRIGDNVDAGLIPRTLGPIICLFTKGTLHPKPGHRSELVFALRVSDPGEMRRHSTSSDGPQAYFSFAASERHRFHHAYHSGVFYHSVGTSFVAGFGLALRLTGLGARSPDEVVSLHRVVLGDELVPVRTWPDALGALVALAERPLPSRTFVAEHSGVAFALRWDEAIGLVFERWDGTVRHEDSVPLLSFERAEALLAGLLVGDDEWDAGLRWHPVRSLRNPKHLVRLATRGWWVVLLGSVGLMFVPAWVPVSGNVYLGPLGGATLAALCGGLALSNLVGYAYRSDKYASPDERAFLVDALGIVIGLAWLVVAAALALWNAVT